ncbi:hypothetical protein DMENIID0001_093040 [Sergentomyia squamirostris]
MIVTCMRISYNMRIQHLCFPPYSADPHVLNTLADGRMYADYPLRIWEEYLNEHQSDEQLKQPLWFNTATQHYRHVQAIKSLITILFGKLSSSH